MTPRSPSPWPMRPQTLRAARTLALAALASLALLAARPWIEAAWQGVLLGWLRSLQLGADLAPRPGPGWLGIAAPRLGQVLPAPGTTDFVLHALAAGAAGWVGGRLPERWRAAAGLLRLAAATHALALLFFAACPGWVPDTPGPHVAALLHQLWGLMLVLPWLQALARPLLPAARWQRLGLALLAQVWLLVLAPCLAASHVALLVLLGPLAMPLLALAGGALPVVMGLVALHAWAASRAG